MSLEKILNIERSINVYQNSDSEPVEEIIINVPLETLKEIVPPKEDDPQLYEGYVLTEQQLAKINQLLENKIIADYIKYFYVLEATAIYDWSAN